MKNSKLMDKKEQNYDQVFIQVILELAFLSFAANRS